MPLFINEAEQERKNGLKRLEEKRVRFAEKLFSEGFAPDRMIFCSDEAGHYAGMARINGKLAVITAPALTEEKDFCLEFLDDIRFTREDVLIPGEGMNGMFGFGKKGARGMNIRIPLSNGEEAFFPFVAARTTWLEVKKAHQNPLLNTKPRRHNANVVWDFMPVEVDHLSRIEKALFEYYLSSQI